MNYNKRHSHPEEKYETVIDRQRVYFHLKYDGFCWIGRAFIDYTVIAVSSSVDSSEKATIKLVSNAEYTIRKNSFKNGK